MALRLLTLLLLLSVLLAAQTQPAPPVLRIPPGAQAGPGFNAEAATRAYLATQTPEQKARSDAYFEGGYWLMLWDFLYSAAISILLLATGLSRRMREAAERIVRRKPLSPGSTGRSTRLRCSFSDPRSWSTKSSCASASTG